MSITKDKRLYTLSNHTPHRSWLIIENSTITEASYNLDRYIGCKAEIKNLKYVFIFNPNKIQLNYTILDII